MIPVYPLFNFVEAGGITRTSAFWGNPAPPHYYPYYWVILDPKPKEDKVKATNLKNLPKFQNFWILKQTLHATHLLKLLDKMCKYEMDPTSIVEDTERTRFCPQRQTDRRTDGRPNGQTDKGEASTPPFNFVEAGGIITAGSAWVRTQHCGYWCPGAKVPTMLTNMHCIRLTSPRNITFIVNNIRKSNYILNNNPVV